MSEIENSIVDWATLPCACCQSIYLEDVMEFLNDNDNDNGIW